MPTRSSADGELCTDRRWTPARFALQDSRHPAPADVFNVRRVLRVLAKKALFYEAFDQEPEYAEPNEYEITKRIGLHRYREETKENAGINRMAHVAISELAMAVKGELGSQKLRGAEQISVVGDLIPTVSTSPRRKISIGFRRTPKSLIPGRSRSISRSSLTRVAMTRLCETRSDSSTREPAPLVTQRGLGTNQVDSRISRRNLPRGKTED